VTLGRARQRAAGQHADADDANAGSLGGIEQSSVILCRIVRRQLLGGRWIEHVVDDLRAVEGAGIDHLMQRRGVADCRDPEETNLALLTQPLERRYHVAEHLSDAQRRSAPCFGNRIVQVKDVDPVKTQSRQAAFERHRYGVGNAVELALQQPDLGADGHIGWLQLLQNAAKVVFRFAIAVLHRGVEIVHAGGDRSRDGTLLVGGIAAHHDSAHCAAAEAQHRELHSGASKDPQLHRCSSDCMRADVVACRTRPSDIIERRYPLLSQQRTFIPANDKSVLC
jgi:hypothetical protein